MLNKQPSKTDLDYSFFLSDNKDFPLANFTGHIFHTFVTTKDSIWMQVVTMTTLGFGDVTPESVLARAFVGMSSVLGIFLMALLISVIHESLQMSQQEKRILAYVERQGMKSIFICPSHTYT